MRTMIFILSATAILFLTTCEEDPTSSNLENRLREIKVFNLDDNSIKKVDGSYIGINSVKFCDNSTLVYSARYSDNNESGNWFSDKLVMNDFITQTNFYSYYTSGDIYGYSCYPEISTIFLSVNGNLYRINGNGESVIRLTNSSGYEMSPLFSSEHSILVYGYIDWQMEYSVMISFNVNTNETDTIVTNEATNRNHFIPLFFDEDSNRLVYIEFNYSYPDNTGWIKSVDLFDSQDIRILTDEIPRMKVGKNLSVDKQIVFLSDGNLYKLDINTSETKFVALGLFGDISPNGEKIVFTTQSELFLINSDGTNQQKLVSKVAEKKYLLDPSFSSNGEQIVYIESDYP